MMQTINVSQPDERVAKAGGPVSGMSAASGPPTTKPVQANLGMNQAAAARTADKAKVTELLKTQNSPFPKTAAATPKAQLGFVSSMKNAPLGRIAPVAGGVMEAVDVVKVVNDPNSTAGDVAAQVGIGTGRVAGGLAGAKLGAVLGAPAGPAGAFVGGLIGGGAGYIGADKFISSMRGEPSPANKIGEGIIGTAQAAPTDSDMIPTPANPNPVQRTPMTAEQLAGTRPLTAQTPAAATPVPAATRPESQAALGVPRASAQEPAASSNSVTAPQPGVISAMRQPNGVMSYSGENVKAGAPIVGTKSGPGVVTGLRGTGVSTIEGGPGDGRTTAEVNQNASRIISEMSAINDKYHQDFGGGARRQPSAATVLAQKKLAQEQSLNAAELGIKSAAAKSDELLKQGQISAMNQLGALRKQVDAAEPGSAEQKALLSKYQILSGKQPSQSKVVLEDFNTGETDGMGQPVWRKRAINAETGQPITAAQPQATPKVTLQADFDKLPKGATYIGADGRTYRK
jgi:hypothetical protein